MSRPVLSLGSTGNFVRELQTALNRVRVAPPLEVDGSFGQLTKTVVVTLQMRQRIQVDGIVGSQTWAALAPVLGGGTGAGPSPVPPPPGGTDGPPSAVAEIAVQIALAQNGVREQPAGSNRGPQVDQYNAISGAGQGQPWCMSFVYWCFVQAASRSGVANPMPKTGYCPYLYGWARNHGKLVATPQRGDIFLVKGTRDGNPSQVHTGLVTGGSINTVEGNTNTDGSSNGVGVFLRTRSASSCYYVRL